MSFLSKGITSKLRRALVLTELKLAVSLWVLILYAVVRYTVKVEICALTNFHIKQI